MTADDELSRLQSENRHLKETIVALRAKLEQQSFAFDDKIDKELCHLREERKHLQATIAALRAKIEAMEKV